MMQAEVIEQARSFAERVRGFRSEENTRRLWIAMPLADLTVDHLLPVLERYDAALREVLDFVEGWSQPLDDVGKLAAIRKTATEGLRGDAT